MVVLYLILDDGSFAGRIEGVAHSDWNVLDADGINCRRVDHLGSEIAEFHGFHVAEFVDRVGCFDHLGVCGHESVDISPDLQGLRLEG